MSKFTACLTLVVLLAAATSSRAAILLQDNFDSYADTAAFQAGAGSTPPGAWTPTGSSGVLSTAQAFSGPNSILVGTAAGRNTHALAADTAPTVTDNIEFSFRFFVTNTTQGRQQADIIDSTGGGNGQIIGMGTSNTPTSSEFFWRVVGVDPDGTGALASGNYGPMDAVAPNRTVGWHELKAVIKRVTASTAAVDFYVDGVLGKSVTGFSLRSFENMRLGSNLSSAGSDAYYDDVLVQTALVPEPAGLGVLAIAAVAAFRRRRRAA